MPGQLAEDAQGKPRSAGPLRHDYRVLGDLDQTERIRRTRIILNPMKQPANRVVPATTAELLP
jgi:hypothetical protein